MRIRQLFVSTGHNYFGHHGKPAGEYPIIEVNEVECVAGEGLRGDRFFGYRPDYKGQITFFAWEVFAALRTELKLGDVSAGALRRNVLTEGVSLDRLIGQTFSVQGVSFMGVEECRPCYWMDRALGSGVETWMKGRGGLRARIVTNGFLRRDDEPPRG